MIHIAINLFLVACLIIQVTFTVGSIIRWRKAGKQYMADMDKFTSKLIKDNQQWKDEYVERQTLLAKENAKLIEQNELYRDKLKNLGFTDITLNT